MFDRLKKLLPSSPRHLVLAGVFCLLLVSGLIAVQVVRADGRILPNVTIGGIDVGGLTPSEAKERLENALRALNVAGVQFRYQDRSLTVRANDVSAASPTQSPVTYDLDGMVETAFAFGHEAGKAELIAANMRALFADVQQPVQLVVDKDALQALLTLRFGELEQPARDAAFTIERVSVPVNNASSSGATRPDWRILVSPDSTGVTFDYGSAIDHAASGLARWQGSAIDLQATTKAPDITLAEAEAFVDRAKQVLARGEASLAYDDLTWSLSEEEIAKALVLLKKKDGSIGLTLKRSVIEPLLAIAAKEIESEPKPTRFTIGEDGRAKDFQGGSLGKTVDQETSLARLDELFDTSENGVFPIAVTTVAAPASDAIAVELGITELLGYGTSNFSGSPKNRRINIANGAARLNGIIIKPGEEIGLIDYLKPFDASGGYVPELVIKGNRTVPEYGGGLCQIGTTTFRATMGAGLPITQRQNHSYRVRYYEPAGTDATLYDPAPDFKFINDTQSHAVLITKIIGDIARFEFWGTRDGRVQKQGPIKTWNITPPPEPKLIETSELAEGVKKCFESPHAGATTNFTYSITYPDGTVKAQDFRSVYKPWQQQCLVGKTGAPRIVLGSDGSIKELAPLPSATNTPPTP
ncbi:MAG: VanW family protein [Patescibacteria group bacterium]|nr:MAG: VanW family protein [Patescibacteria group bacterium]